MIQLQNKARYLRPNVSITYPSASERDYYRVLRAISRKLRALTVQSLDEIKKALHRDETDTERVIRLIKEALEQSKTLEGADIHVKRILSGVDKTIADNIRRSFKNCLGVDVFVPDNSELLKKVTDEWYTQQSQLTKSIVSTYTEKLQTIISNAVQRGSAYSSIKDEVKKLYDITDNRAKFIARNEVSNLNGIITRVRQMESGIGIYEWSSSKDESVRETHAINDGKLFFWNRNTAGEINGIKVYPAPKYHPGMDYNCRCVAIPVIDTESWNVGGAVPLGMPVPNKATEVGNEQFYIDPKSITDKKITMKIYDRNVSANEIRSLGGKYYITSAAKIKPKGFHNLRQWIHKAQKVLGIEKSPNAPRIIIASSKEINYSAAVYDYAENVIYFSDFMGDKDEILERQKNGVVPYNVLSIFVHEFIHWMDGEKYRRKYGGSKEEYLKWIKMKSQNFVEILRKSGYDVNKISQYARFSMFMEKYDEVFVEYRTKKALMKGGN